MKLFAYANEYVQQSDWKTLAFVKFCLCAIGVMIGALLPDDKKKPALILSGFIFIATYIPLMTKLFRIFSHRNTQTVNLTSR